MPTAIAAYEIANADLSTAEFIANEVFTRSQFRLQRLGNDTVRSISQAGSASINDVERKAKHVVKELRYFADRDAKSVATSKGLVGKDVPAEFERKISDYQARLAQGADLQVKAVEAALSRFKGQK